MKKFVCVLVLTSIGLFLIVSKVFAAGFALPEQGAAAMGMSSAFIGQADDASAVWYNPAGITQLEGTRIMGGLVTIYPTMTHENTDGTTDVSHRKIFFPLHLYATHKTSDRISLGLGVNNPFGLGSNWGNTSATSNVATLTDLVATEINPVIAYKITDNLSAAVGVAYVKVEATLASIWPTGQEIRIKGDGYGWGGNAAIHYRPSDQLHFGFSYRSRVRMDLDGTASYAGGAVSNPASTSMTLPDLLQFGVSYKITDNLTLNTDIGYTWWSTYDKLVIHSATFPPIGGTDPTTQQKQWNDVWNLRIGGQYKLDDHWKLRAGLQYDQTPVPDHYFETRVPDSDRVGASIGVGYTFGNLTVDVAYLYMVFLARHINESTADDAFANPDSLQGTYKSDAHVVGLSIGYKF